MNPRERRRLLKRRDKLQALAQRGIDGERDNAIRMLADFDERHPELKTLAEPYRAPEEARTCLWQYEHDGRSGSMFITPSEEARLFDEGPAYMRVLFKKYDVRL